MTIGGSDKSNPSGPSANDEVERPQVAAPLQLSLHNAKLSMQANATHAA